MQEGDVKVTGHIRQPGLPDVVLDFYVPPDAVNQFAEAIEQTRDVLAGLQHAAIAARCIFPWFEPMRGWHGLEDLP